MFALYVNCLSNVVCDRATGTEKWYRFQLMHCMTLVVGLMLASGPLQAGVELEGDSAVHNGTYMIGQQDSGSMRVDGGTVLDAEGIFVALSIGSEGHVLVTDPGTQVRLAGPNNRLGVGEQGVGKMIIEDGAIVDGTVDPANCGGGCNFFIANAAGSTGKVILRGAGSELHTMNFLGVAGAAVFTQDQDGFDMGEPGGSSYGRIEILDGALLNSQFLGVSSGAGGDSATGEESTEGVVIVSGTGSRLVSDGVGIAENVNATGTVQVEDGAVINTRDLFLNGNGNGDGKLIVASGGRVEVQNLQVSPWNPGSGDARLDVSAGVIETPAVTEWSDWSIGGAASATLRIRDGGVVRNNLGGIFVAGAPETFVHIRIHGRDSIMESNSQIVLGQGGSCLVNLAQGTIRAPVVRVGSNCRVVGRGTLAGEVQIEPGGMVARSIRVTNF